MAIDIKSPSLLIFLALAGVLRHHQRRFDGKHGYACNFEEPIEGILAKRGTLAKKMCARNYALNSRQREHINFSPSISCVRQLHTTCTAASQSSHNVGSTGEPSAHFKPPIRSSISPAGPALALPDGLEEDPHRVIAFDHGDHVRRV